MRIWTIEYVNYEGDLKTKEIELEGSITENEVKYLAILEDDSWGDGIKEILSCY